MKTIRNSRQLHEEIQRLKMLDRMQGEALMKRVKTIETSLQPANLVKNGIKNLFKKNGGGSSLVPALVGAGVEAGLQRLMEKNLLAGIFPGGQFAGNIMNLVSGLVNTDKLTEKVKSFFAKKTAEKEYAGEEGEGDDPDEIV